MLYLGIFLVCSGGSSGIGGLSAPDVQGVYDVSKQDFRS